MNINKINKLDRQKSVLHRKKKTIEEAFQVSREAMQSNLITPAQRQSIRDILRPVIKDLERRIHELSLKINEEFSND